MPLQHIIKNCFCYLNRLSQKIKHIKGHETDEQKQLILEKRQQTVIDRYGVGNVSRLTEVIDKIKNMKYIH